MLHEVWSMLTSKYMPSIAAEATKLWIQFEGLRQRGRTMQEHIKECMTLRNKLLAVNEPVPDRQFTHKLLNVDKEQAHANIDAIISGLTDAYAFMHMNDPPRHQHQHQQGHAGRGRFKRRFPRGSGAPHNFSYNWYQGYGRDGYPAIYLNLGEGKPVLRTKPVDDGKVWTSVSAAVEQVRVRSERHNEHIAALQAGSQRQEVTSEFLAHLAFNHCGDNVMKLMLKHPDLYDLNLGPANRVVGHAEHCTGCLVANRRLGARASYNHCLTKVATSPGECYFADVAGPISPLGIGGAKYILVAVDAFTRFLHVIPMRGKSQAASLLAQLFERVRVQVIRKHNNGVRKLHTDKGDEFMSRDLESFCAWRGIVHTFSDTATHQSNGVAERRIGQLTTGIRSCLLRSCLPHTLWVEAAMHVAHAQILPPTQTLLNRESGTTSKERQYTDLEELTRLAPDIR